MAGGSDEGECDRPRSTPPRGARTAVTWRNFFEWGSAFGDERWTRTISPPLYISLSIYISLSLSSLPLSPSLSLRLRYSPCRPQSSWQITPNIVTVATEGKSKTRVPPSPESDAMCCCTICIAFFRLPLSNLRALFPLNPFLSSVPLLLRPPHPFLPNSSWSPELCGSHLQLWNLSN